MEAILILGAAVWPDGPSPTLRRRTTHGAKLWHDGAAPLVIPCGGLGKHGPTEAAAMQTILMGEGVPGDCILQEDQSTTTLENIRNAKRLISGNLVTIVTDGYHARRAAMVARHFGLEATLSCPPGRGVPIRHSIREAMALPTYAIRLRRTRLTAD